MTREWLLLGASVGASLALGLALLRWLAPELLGGPPDLRIVRSSEAVVPFYEHVFRERDPEGSLLVNDPHLLVRARPLRAPGPRGLSGPTDVLGFRNAAVPNRPTVVAIGDSQTWGINATLAETWPSQLERRLAARGAAREPVVYSMATGGWAAVQYLDIFQKALAFRPRATVVAFYSGNDGLESFRAAYGVERWAELRPDPSLELSDRPRLPRAERTRVWQPTLASGHTLHLRPFHRLLANQRHPAIEAGWEIMAEVARRIAAAAPAAGSRVLFTVIPTQELVHRPLLAAEGLDALPAYAELVALEEERIRTLGAVLAAQDGATYVDLVTPLQRAAQRGAILYPDRSDGHPNAAGYAAIAAALAGPVAALLAE